MHEAALLNKDSSLNPGISTLNNMLRHATVQ